MLGQAKQKPVIISVVHFDSRMVYLFKQDSVIRKQYLKIRSQLLQQRYGVSCEQTSVRSRSISARSSSRVGTLCAVFKVHCCALYLCFCFFIIL
jgi:hypothetical protein